MNLRMVYLLLEEEIRKNYKSKTECAKFMNISKQELNNILKSLKENKGITFNKLHKVLNFFNYEFIIKKRG